MSIQCIHPETIEVTTLGDDHYQFLCMKCGDTFSGKAIPLINSILAKLYESENERKIKEWGILIND